MVQWEELCLGGLGAVCATVFTNPLEVIKIRIQLQGELQSRGKYTVHYRNVFQAFYAVAKQEKLLSLQNGLVPNLYYQFIMNGCRFGVYQMFDNAGFVRDASGNIVLLRSVLASAFAGGLGTYVGNPFYMLKIHLQSKSDSKIAVGYQHDYSTMREGFRTILREHGVRGLWLGGNAAILRGTVCGSFQMTSFALLQTYFNKTGLLVGWWNTMISSLIASMALCAVTNPVDVISARVCNQAVDHKTGRGTTYHGIVDCAAKIFATEGIHGFYKGMTAAIIKNGPHTMLCLLFWQFWRKQYFHLINKDSVSSDTSDTKASK